MAKYTSTKYPGVRAYETAKGTRYEAQARDITGRMVPKGGFVKLTDAKHYRDAQVGAKAEGRTTEVSTITYDEWFTRWFAAHAPTVSDGHAKDMADLHRRHLSPVLGALKLATLTDDDVKAVIGTMRKADLGARSQQKAKRQVSQVLKAAVGKVAGVNANVADRVKSPKVQKNHAPESHALTVAQVEKLIAACGDRGDWLKPIIRMLAYAGLRPSELMGLTRKSFNVEAGTLTISETLRQVNNGGETVRSNTTKTAKARTIKLQPDLALDLTRRARLMLPDAPFFPGARGGTVVLLTTIRAAFNVAKGRAGADFPEWPTPYTLRHTCATLLAREGVAITTAAKFMGHDPAEFVKTYADVFNVDLDAAADAIANARAKAVGA